MVALVFIPETRSLTYVLLFSGTLGTAWTIKFWRSTSTKVEVLLSDCSDRINVVLSELSGNPAQNMTPKELEQLIVSGARHEFDVNGVPDFDRLFHAATGGDAPSTVLESDTES